MNMKIKIGLLMLVVVLAWVLWPAKNESRDNSQSAEKFASRASVAPHVERTSRRHLAHDEAAPQDYPQGTVEYVFDKLPSANRFLFAKGRDEKFRENSDAPSGMDLWLQDESGNDRLVGESVTRAKFSPDGNKIAFTSRDGTLHVEELTGKKLAAVPGVYGPSWKPDSTAVIFSKVGEGQDPLRPGTRQLRSLDIASGKVAALTDGHFDDGRPEFNPTSEWILFVSGARSGIASFWKVPARGGVPEQVTNVGLQQVNEHFVPTPYDHAMWSPDNQWFVYDFKAGEQQETWGLRFDPKGKLQQATKLADGINPRWHDDGRTFVCEKITDHGKETIVATLP